MTENGKQSASDLLADAVRTHGQATADLFARMGKPDEKVDLVRETMECTDRLVRTAARFFVYWDNFSELFDAEPGKTGATYGASPIGGPTCRTTEWVVLTAGSPFGTVSTTALRRRGTADRTVAGNRITLVRTAGEVEVTVRCEGAERGVYDGTLHVGDTSTPYNVYIDPSP